MKQGFRRALCLLVLLCLLLALMPCTFAAGYDNGYAGGMAGDNNGILARGVDISTWQGHNVDFKKVKEQGYSFVILRAGFATTKDDTFEENYAGAKAAGLDVGVYLYSYADDTAEAREEAAALKTWLAGKTLEYPVYYDLEEPSIHGPMSVQTLSDIAMAFLDVMAADGWLVGLYSCRSWLSSKLDTQRVCARYECWLAQYLASGTCDTYDNYDGMCGMWQYSSSGSVEGIPGNVDMNVCFKDYPMICKKYGFNGYSATGATMVLMGASFSPVLYSGAHMTINGRITSSSGKLSSVTVGFYDEKGAAVKTKSIDPRDTSYDLSALDTAVRSQDLAEGRYEYRISATNGFERLTLYSHEVVVSRQGIRVDELSAPEDQKEGDSFRLTGKITSLSALSAVNVTVKQKNTIVLQASAAPQESSFDLLALAGELKFETLKLGEYTCVVEAVTGKGKTTVLNRSFHVWVRNDPITLTDFSLKTDYYPGDEISLTGTVSSTSSDMTAFTFEILNSRGSVVTAAQPPKAAKKIELGTLSEKMELSGLGIGIYTCRITTQNDAGPKTVVEKNFFVRPDAISLCDAQIPTRLQTGETCLLAGVLASDASGLEFVSLTVTDPNGLPVLSDAAIPKGNTFDLSQMNDTLIFSRLPANDYTLRIYARNAHCDETVYEATLVVRDEGDLIRWADGCFDPTGIDYCPGNTPGVWGELLSDSSPISQVTASIVTKEGKIMASAKLTPNRTAVQLDTLDEKLRFSALGAGEYRFVITATNTMDTYEMLNASFRVTECPHTHITAGNTYGAVCTSDGAVCDTRCLDCGEKISGGTRLAHSAHSYQNGVCTGCGKVAPIRVSAQETKVIPGSGGRIVIAGAENGKWYALGSDGSAVKIDAPKDSGEITVAADLLWTPEPQPDGTLRLRNAAGMLLHLDSAPVAGRGVAHTALHFSTNGLKMELIADEAGERWLSLQNGRFVMVAEPAYLAVFVYTP